jgi:hypothetical protein
MSGSNYSRSSYSSGDNGISTSSIDDCSNFKRKTQVMSPTMSFFSLASVGDELKVILDNETVVLLNLSHDEVGGINPTWISKLIECLKQGNTYVAEITRINGAAIDILIKNV